MLANLTFGLFVLLGFFMMCIILLQRGRGGGLAGAFGGAGGSSAFGTRAGDVFTKITVVVAVLWVAMACASIYAFRAGQNSRFKGGKDANDTVTNPDSTTGDNEDANFKPDPFNTPKDKEQDAPVDKDKKPVVVPKKETKTETPDPKKSALKKEDSAPKDEGKKKPEPPKTPPKSE